MRNIFVGPRPEQIAEMPEGVAGNVDLRTSRELEIERLEARLAAGTDHWKCLVVAQERLDQLRSSGGAEAAKQ